MPSRKARRILPWSSTVSILASVPWSLGRRGLLERMRLGWVHFSCRSRGYRWVPFARRLPVEHAVVQRGLHGNCCVGLEPQGLAGAVAAAVGGPGGPLDARVQERTRGGE